MTKQEISLFAVLVCFATFVMPASGQANPNQSQTVQLPSVSTTTPPLQNAQSLRGIRSTQEGLYVVTDSRPLARVADLLERRLGIPVSYEDASWKSPGDVVRASELTGNAAVAAQHVEWKSPLVPNEGTVSLSISPALVAPASREAVRAVLDAALSSHQARHNPGIFALVELQQGGLSIVPREVEAADGKVVLQTSPLDVRISFPEQERNASDTLDTIYAAIRAQGKVPLSRGVDSREYFQARRIRVGAQNEIARDVLDRALRMTNGVKISWRLYYEPGSQSYMIHLHGVEFEEHAANGGIHMKALRWNQ